MTADSAAGGRCELGRGGPPVSRIGLGLAAIGRPAYVTAGRDRDLGDDRRPEVLEARTHELLDAALAAGVRYLDTARSYGSAETFLGSWLRARAIPADAVTVGSKWGYRYVGAWRMDADVHEVKDHGLGALREQLPESRRLLDPWLRLYQVHSATLESGILERTDVLGALAGLAQDGLRVGISTSGPDQAEVIRRALDARVDGRAVFTTVQATWNLLEPSVAPALAEAHATGWGVIVKEALANGRLVAPDELPGWLAAAAARHGISPDAVAIAAALAQPWADVVLSGAVTPDQLQANLRSRDVAFAPGELDELIGHAEPRASYWSARRARAWR